MKAPQLAVSIPLIFSFILASQAFADNGATTLPPKYSLSGGGFDYSGLSGWSIKAGLIYEQFSNNGSNFAESSNHKIFNISPKYHTGYDLGISYSLPNVGSDLHLNYRHFHTSDSSDAWASSLTLFPDSLNLGPVTWASSELSYDFDELDFTAGHWVRFSDKFRAQFYGGLSYLHLSRDMETWGSGFGNDIWITGGTSFRGVGPTFGMDSYCSPMESYPNFSIYGGLKSSAVYGTMTGYVRTNDNGIRESDQIPNEKVVVPSLGAKIGLDWMYQYKGAIIGLNLGYEANQYWGVTKDSNYTTPNNASYQGATLSANFRF